MLFTTLEYNNNMITNVNKDNNTIYLNLNKDKYLNKCLNKYVDNRMW